LLAAETPQGRRQVHLDHLGSARLITNDAGQTLGAHTYLPFGAELDSAEIETPVEAKQFTGHERDTLPGDLHTLDYMHARYYGAAWGRFLSVDPTIPVQAVRVPQLWNRYAYVANNPMKHVDPDGRLLQLSGCVKDQSSDTCKSQFNT